MRNISSIATLSALICLSGIACQKTETSQPKSPTANKTSKKTKKKQVKAPTKATPTPTIKQDEAILTAMRAVITKCKTIKYNRGKSCPNQEQKAYDSLLNQKQLQAFDTLVSLFSDTKTPLPMRQLAAHGLNYNMITAFGSAKKQDNAISKTTAVALKQAVLAEDPKDRNKFALAGIKAAVHALNLTGQHEEVTALIDAIDDKKSRDHMWVKYHAIDNAMNYSGLALFEMVKKYAQHSDTSIQRSAFNAPRKIMMWNKAENDAICPWAKSYLSKTDKAWNAGPTWLLLKCTDRDTYAKAIVDEAEHRTKAGTFARPFTFAFRELCARRALGPQNYKTDAHCKRSRALLLKITESTTIPIHERVVALSAIAYQWRDKESLKVMTTYTKSKTPELAKMAKSEIKMLNRWINKKRSVSNRPN